MPQLNDYLQTHRKAFEDDLCEWLRIPSVSADSRHRDDIQKAAEWVLGQFQRCGLEARLYPTELHPIVFAQTPPVPGAPVVLVYGHYDVQPPDPLNEWITPPFEPSIRNGNVYARGATDDKGQVLTHVKSVQAWLESQGSLPVQIKFLIEGEEEVGSQSLGGFLEQHRDQLACDVVVISDTSQLGPGQPAITYGLRGIAYYELFLTGPRQDLHSGTFGGAVINPAIVLSQILSKLLDDQGRIQLPGFYDDVVPLTQREREAFAALPFNEEEFKQRLGVEAVGGEVGYSTLERRSARPTFDINGLWSGYQGEGAKTVLPCRAGAKFSFRLVPNQDPAKVTAALQAFIQQHCPPGVRAELIDHHGASGFLVPLESPYVTAAAAAIEQGFGHRPYFIREGGSIPIVTKFSRQLGADVLLLGWGLDDDNTHSPNEKFHLEDFHRGIRASAYLWWELSKLTPRRSV
jgi:succinyl-diaminopimelate desuccinylase